MRAFIYTPKVRDLLNNAAELVTAKLLRAEHTCILRRITAIVRSSRSEQVAIHRIQTYLQHRRDNLDRQIAERKPA